MRTIVITGGTDGMGAALARHYLAVGEKVVVIGRSRAKFDALLTTVHVPARAEFIAADLSLVADSRRVTERLTREHERVDALILAASYIRQRRHLTSEGHEASWALFFLSKYLFITELADLLARAASPVVVNTAVPGAGDRPIDFEDLEVIEGFTFKRANTRQRRANELLGIIAMRRIPGISYVTWGPNRLVRTSFAGDVGLGMKAAAAILGPLLGQRPTDAVRPIIDLVDSPVPGRSAYRGPKKRQLTAGDEEEATRLDAAVEASW